MTQTGDGLDEEWDACVLQAWGLVGTPGAFLVIFWGILEYFGFFCTVLGINGIFQGVVQFGLFCLFCALFGTSQGVYSMCK